jgi:hypothetical protein
MLTSDTRKYEDPEDMVGACRTCGTSLILLPNDKRQGYCFDCYDFLSM